MLSARVLHPKLHVPCGGQSKRLWFLGVALKNHNIYVDMSLIIQEDLVSLGRNLNKCSLEQQIYMYLITQSPSFKLCSCPLQSVPEKKY